MAVAGLEPGDVDERAIGFRLGPRLNAAGRMRRADAALELLMTADEARAAEVARELDLLNPDRREAELRILAAAEAAACAARPARARSWWRARAGTRAWSASSPRGWWSAGAARLS